MTTLHPFLAHFPVALLLFGAGTAVGARFRASLAEVSWWAWVVGALASLAATVTGLIDHVPYEATEGHALIERHQIAGMITTVLALALLGWRFARRRRGADPVPRNAAYVALAVAAAVGVVVAGATGGPLVYEHGVNVEAISWPLR